jgi:hypothetical protein
MKKNDDAFMYWLKVITGANIKQASVCYHCLNEWCKIFLKVQKLGCQHRVAGHFWPAKTFKMAGDEFLADSC